MMLLYRRQAKQVCVTKRNGDDNELESLKIMQRREFHNSKEIHRRIVLAAPSNSFSKDN